AGAGERLAAGPVARAGGGTRVRVGVGRADAPACRGSVDSPVQLRPARRAERAAAGDPLVARLLGGDGRRGRSRTRRVDDRCGADAPAEVRYGPLVALFARRR